MELILRAYVCIVCIVGDHLLAETNLAVKLEQIRKCLDKESSRTKVYPSPRSLTH